MLQLRKILLNTRAAVDLASVMVGIIIIGIIGGLVATTIFAVIPWAQDKQAKANLSAARTAQDVYIGLSATGDLPVKPAFATPLLSLINFTSISAAAAEPSNTANFGTYDDLIKNKLIQKTSSLNMGKGTDGQCYVITSYSQTGRVFWYDSTQNGIKSYDSATSSTTCNGTDLSKLLPQAYLDAQKPVTTPTPAPTSNPTTPPATSTPTPTSSPTTPTPTPTPTPTTPPVVYPVNVYSTGFGSSQDRSWLVSTNGGKSYISAPIATTVADRSGSTNNPMLSTNTSSGLLSYKVPVALDAGTYVITYWTSNNLIGNNTWTITAGNTSVNTPSVDGSSWKQVKQTIVVDSSGATSIILKNNRNYGGTVAVRVDDFVLTKTAG